LKSSLTLQHRNDSKTSMWMFNQTCTEIEYTILEGCIKSLESLYCGSVMRRIERVEGKNGINYRCS